MSEEDVVKVNRAPVMTLWAAVVARTLGHDRDTALTLGKAVAGLNAQSKGRALGVFGPGPAKGESEAAAAGRGEDGWVVLLGRAVPVKETPAGARAVVKDKPIEPVAVEAYLARAFGDRLGDVTEAMAFLAASVPEGELAEAAYPLYERLRPDVPKGKRGWGAKGDLDLAAIRCMAGR